MTMNLISSPGKRSASAAILFGFLIIPGGIAASAEGQQVTQTPGATLVQARPGVQTYMVPMRDGIKLATDVYGAGAAPAPVILVRTPYGRTTRGAGALSMATLLGYVVVIQDVRGRFDSEGDFSSFFEEGNDGYDTIEWIAAQRWCNGKVGMFGASYLAITQWAAAMKAPPHLTCLFAAVAPADSYQQATYQGGVLRQEMVQGWTASIAASSPWWGKHQADSAGQPGINDRMATWMWHVPLSDPGPIARGGPAFLALWKEILDHPTDDALWQGASLVDHFDQVKVPAMIMGGWYDAFDQGCVDEYVGIKANGGTALARSNVHLIMGPFTHSMSPRVGQVDFGQNAGLDMIQFGLPWFNHWLKGAQNDVEQWPAVRVFAMGTNQWVSLPDWPPADARPVSYYLENATTDHGAGALSPDVPGTEQPSSYTYDPLTPVPTVGGNVLTIPNGIYDQSQVEKRPDVLVFTGPVLQKPTHVAGRVTVRLWASASTPDTDFTAKLVDVGPTGYAANVLDGIIRARYRQSFRKVTLIEPGKPELYTIDLWSTDQVFLPGHRIRVDISSSNFPRFERNLNTGGDNGKDATSHPANILIYHDRDHASYIELPVEGG